MKKLLTICSIIISAVLFSSCLSQLQHFLYIWEENYKISAHITLPICLSLIKLKY